MKIDQDWLSSVCSEFAAAIKLPPIVGQPLSLRTPKARAAQRVAMKVRSVEAGWTGGKIARLKSLLASGMSAHAIAEDIGHSRSAVLGKIFRLGLSTPHAAKPRKPKSPKPRWNAGDRATVNNIRNAQQRRRRGPIAPAETRDLPPDQSTFAVPFLDRKPLQCAWPLWATDTPAAERMVCGAPAMVIVDQRGNVRACSYCQRHRAIAYGGEREPFVRRSRYGVRAA